MESKQVPAGVKVLSVLNWIFAVLLILGGIAGAGLGLLNLGTAETTGFGNLPGFSESIGQSILYAVFFLAFGVFLIFVALGLWKGRNWARIVEIVFGFIGIIWAVWGLIQLQFGNVFSLAINGLIVGYLLFNQKVKQAFS